MDKKLSFQQENDLLLNYILDTSILDKLKTMSFEEQEKEGFFIELNITSVCNQKCEYCYLTKYGDELYPPEIRNQDRILKNLRIFFDYLIKQNIRPFRFDLFSGEIWGMKFGNKVFDILLEYLDKGMDFRFVMIPSNMSFLTNPKVVQVIQNYIYKFKQRNVILCFSASFDGKEIDTETRSYKDEDKNVLKSNEEFYDRLFAFCEKNNYGFHPMVGAYKIEKWIDNIEWYYNMFDKYHLDKHNAIMLLEVRNDYWTRDKIDEYLKFIDFLIEYKLERFYNNSIEEFANDIFGLIPTRNGGYRNYEIISLNKQPHLLPGCTIHRSLIVRLGDLAIGPCHRTHYEKFIYGNFIVEDDKIVGIKANNIQMANRILLMSLNSHPKCSGCKYKNFCIKGCFGAQYEANSDPLVPCNTVCDLFKNKINFLLNKYQKMGVLDIIKKKDTNLYNECINVMNGSEFKEWIELKSQK